MLTDQTTSISSGRTSFCTETCSISNMFDWQFRAIQNCFTIHICYRNFRCRNQEIFFSITSNFISILFKLRKLTGSDHTVTTNHKWCKNFFITMFSCMNIQKEIHNGTFKSCTSITIKCKTGTSCLCCSFWI